MSSIINVQKTLIYNKGSPEASLTARIYDFVTELGKNANILRWAIVNVDSEEGVKKITLEITMEERDRPSPLRNYSTDLKAEKPLPSLRPLSVIHIVPTGVRADIGGSLGDAGAVTRAMGQCADLVVGHPNIWNAGPLNSIQPNHLYVEGYALDRFAQEQIMLEQAKGNKMGVIIDCGPRDHWAIQNTLNQVEGFRAATGAWIAGIEITPKPVGGRAYPNASGAFVGEVETLEPLYEKAESLIKNGAEVLAIFTFIKVPEKYWNGYFASKLPNPVGGLEAIISHSITKKFAIPAAHAPLLTKAEIEFLQSRGIVRSTAGLEASIPFYTISVLQGLMAAPRLVAYRNDPNHQNKKKFALRFIDVDLIVTPASSLGGLPILMAEKYDIPVIGVVQNQTILKVSAQNLELKNVIEVPTYLEVLGLLQWIKETKEKRRNKTRIHATELKERVESDSERLKEIGQEVAMQAYIDPDTLLRPLYGKGTPSTP